MPRSEAAAERSGNHADATRRRSDAALHHDLAAGERVVVLFDRQGGASGCELVVDVKIGGDAGRRYDAAVGPAPFAPWSVTPSDAGLKGGPPDASRMRILLALAALVAAGCVTPAASDDVAPAGASLSGAPVPEVFDWTGHVVASEIEGPTHFRPTEDALWPVFQEGIMFHVEEVPQAMEVSLDWTGDGEFMIMLHSHKADGTNTYVEHITELDATNPKCLRVPTADLTEGHWQVMVHSEGAKNADFNLHVALFGGAGMIDMEERHGHWPQDGDFAVDEHEIEACVGSPS
ncbi:MAG TPA: hypothetical protein VM370_05375 [Candidatus Thermoplasmatota archaeon]|nr:hypothetical protein [Candidatus Thermoplasmatota archaeon]